MKIIIHLPNEEGLRKIEDVEENIMPAHQFIVRKIEQILGGQQIRYTDIEVTFSEE